MKQRQEAEQLRQAEEQKLRERQEAEQKQAAAEAARKKQAEEEAKKVAEIQRQQKEEAERRKAADDKRLQEARESRICSVSCRKKSLMPRPMRLPPARRRWRSTWPWSPRRSSVVGTVRCRRATTLLCQVTVRQTPAGVVLSAKVGSCNGDAAVKQSVENAVISASPLPTPSNPRLFRPELTFNFRPGAG